MDGRKARTEAFGIPAPSLYVTPPLRERRLVQRQRLNGDIFWPFMGGLILGAIIFTQVGRSIAYAAGRRVARRLG